MRDNITLPLDLQCICEGRGQPASPQVARIADSVACNPVQLAENTNHRHRFTCLPSTQVKQFPWQNGPTRSVF